MSYITISTEKNETYSSISNFFIDYYMTHANGEFVKIYLYLVRLMSSKEPISVADIADHFNLTEKDICRAIKYWIGQNVLRLDYNNAGVLTGITLLPLEEKKNEADMLSRDSISLLQISGDETSHTMAETADNAMAATVDQVSAGTATVSPANVAAISKIVDNNIANSRICAAVPEGMELDSDGAYIPQKTSVSPSRLTSITNDPTFSDVAYQAQVYLKNNKLLSAADLEKLIYIYYDLEFGQDLTEYLIMYCAELDKTKLAYAKAVAIAWWKKGIKTKEDAELEAKEWSKYKPVIRTLGLAKPTLAPKERAFVDSWLGDLGYDMPIIIEACQTAIISSPLKVNFPYIDSILRDWHDHHVTTLDGAKKYQLERQQMYEKNKKEKQTSANTSYTTKKNSFYDYNKREDGKDMVDMMEKIFDYEINGGGTAS